MNQEERIKLREKEQGLKEEKLRKIKGEKYEKIKLKKEGRIWTACVPSVTLFPITFPAQAMILRQYCVFSAWPGCVCTVPTCQLTLGQSLGFWGKGGNM